MTGWTTGICKTNGIDLHYLRTGGEKPPVVLLHGLLLNGACWIPFARALEREYDVIMPDARGHGNSAAPDQGYRYENLASDVVNLIDLLRLDSPVLLGHSMGGMTAAVVASQHSKRLRGLILVEPTFLTLQRQREVYESDIADRHRKILNSSREDFLAEMRLRRSHRSQEIIELFSQARFQTSAYAFEVLKPPNPNYEQLINTLDLPSLLVFGEDSSVVSPEMAAELAERNHQLKIAEIAQASHAAPYDQPERFTAVVQTFLRSISV